MIAVTIQGKAAVHSRNRQVQGVGRERNEVVVTYADLSESSDNEAIGGLLNEHTIAEGKEPIPLPYRLPIRPHNVLLACKGADEHYQGAFG